MSLDKIGNSLIDSIRNDDWISVDQLAHRLKSSSLSVGALQVWTLCKNIEFARTAESDKIPDSYADEMKVAIDQADAVIRSFIAADNESGVQIKKAS